MKKVVGYFLMSFSVFVLVTSCTHSDTGKANRSRSEVKSMENDAKKLNHHTDAIGPFFWGMPESTCSKLMDGWKDELRQDGFIQFGGFKVSDNALTMHYDSEGHLEQINVDFQKYSVHPEADYSDEEKSLIERNYYSHNKKIQYLVDLLSSIYGEPEENNFDPQSNVLYNMNDSIALAKWKNEAMQVVLNARNKTVEGMTGCEMKMNIRLIRIK